MSTEHNGNGHIPVEEEETVKQNGRKSWTEEFVAAGEELFDVVMELARETNVRRVVVKNEKHNIHLEVPLLLGVAGIAVAPVYAALGLIAALVTDCTILVERIEKKPTSETADATE